MKRLFTAILLLFTSALIAQNKCNLKATVTQFNQAQQTQGEPAAKLYSQAAQGFKTCKQWQNYATAAFQSANIYTSINQPNEAKKILEECRPAVEQYLENDNKVKMAVIHSLGDIYYQLNNFKKAAECYQIALKCINQINQNKPSNDLAICLFNLGNTHEQLNENRKAISYHLQSLKIHQQIEPEDVNQQVLAYSILAELYKKIDKNDSSIYYLNLTKNTTNKIGNDLKPNILETAYVQFKETQIYYEQNEIKKAFDGFLQIKNELEANNLTNNDLYANSNLYLALIYEQRGQLELSYSCLTKAYQIQANIEPRNKTTFVNTIIPFARVLYKQNKFEEAIIYYKQGLSEAGNSKYSIEINIALAKIYEANKNLNEAEQHIKSAIQQIDTDTVNLAIFYADALACYGTINSDIGNYNEALTKFHRALNVLPDEETNLRADIISAIGQMYLKENDTKQAINKLNLAIELIHNIDSTDIRLITLNENIANACMQEGKIAEAISLYNKSLIAKIKKYGNIHPDLVETYNNLGSACYTLSKFNEAKIYYDKAEKIANKTSIPSTKLYGLYNNIGLNNKALGEYKSALLYLNQSLEIKTKIYGAENIICANTINNIGTVYDRLGYWDLAMDYFNKAENLTTKNKGDLSLNIAEIYINKGNLYNKLEQYDLALDYYNKSLNLKINKLSKTHHQLAIIYNNIGVVYQNRNETKKSREYFQKTLEIQIQSSGPQSVNVAESYINIGNTLQKENQTKNAILYYTKAYEIYKNLKNINPIHLGNTYNNMATAYLKAEEYDSSQVFYTKAAEKYSEVYGEKHPYLSLIYNSLGDLYLKTELYDEAIATYNQSIAANHRDYDANSQNNILPSQNGYFDKSIFFKTILAKANALVQQYMQKDNQNKLLSNLETVFLHYELCDSMIHDMRKSAITKQDKLTLGALALKCYEGALEVCIELMNNETDETKKQYYQQKAFLYIEKSRANALLESIAGQDAMELANIPDSLKRIEKILSADMLFYEKLLAERPKNSLEIRDSLFEANKRYNKFIDHLELYYPDYHDIKYADNIVSLNELQSKINENTQIRMYMNGQSYMFIMTIENDDCKIYSQPVYKHLNDSIRLYRNSILQTSQKAAIRYRTMGNSLYNYLFPENINNEKVKHLVIIPDGSLNQISFESLLSEKYQGGLYDYIYYPYLLKNYTISYSYSSSLYYRTLTLNNSKKINSWAGFAPIFNEEDLEGKGIVLDTRFSDDEKHENYRNIIPPTNTDPLPSSETEIRDIFKMFRKKGYLAKGCLFASASKQHFNSDSIAPFKFIHLATHGFVDSEKPELSNVQFTNLEGDRQAGLLYSSAVYAMKFNCDLLILSACETGLGKIMKGEGIVGLSRAFIIAGTSNLIVSLWKVADISTSKLMIEFYKQLLNANICESGYSEILQAAKLKLINNPKYARPYFWSPFILIGK